MAADLITQHSDFIPSSISYGAPRVNARGGKAIKIINSSKNTLVLSTPLMLTWGINKMTDDDTGRVSYNLALQFPSSDYTNDVIESFFQKMKEMESKILDDCVVNSKEWFGKPKMSREVAEALFTPMLKYPKEKGTEEIDYSRSPTMRIKIPFWNEKFNVELYDTNRKPLFTPDMDLGSTAFESLIPKASHISAAIQCNGLWFAGGKFGVTWQLVQSIVRRPVRIQGGCFLNLTENDKQTIEDANSREAAKQEEEQQVNEEPVINDTQVDDSDDEHDDDTESVPPPAPVKKPKRKVVKKKSTK
jgi:hypothetical protein